MKLVDANVLVHAANADAREHASAKKWIEAAFLGTEPIGFAWIALLAFIRVSTRRSLLVKPLRIADAFGLVEDWLSAHNAAVVHPGEDHAAILRSLLEPLGTAGNLTNDAHLAALAIKHGAELVSFDRDFNRFEGLRTVILKPQMVAMFNLEGIDHVAIGVRDIERSAKWYVDILGFERLHEGMWNGVPTFIGKGNTGIALFPASHQPTSSEQREIRMLHLAFRADRENFLAAQCELEKRGIEFEFQDHEIAHSIYFRDPDGHQLEITTYDVAKS